MALRGSEIVRQLMVYAGKESAVVGAVDLSRIVKEMIELLKVSVSKHVRLEMDLGDDLPVVQADAAQLRQVVMNLVTNASEAISDRDGVIRVTTRQAGANQGSIGVERRIVNGGTARGLASPHLRVGRFSPWWTCNDLSQNGPL